MIEYLILFVFALAGVLALTPVVRRVAFRVGAIDVPDERKVHKTPTPRLGGVALYVGFYVSLLIASRIRYFRFPAGFFNKSEFWLLWVGSTVVFGVGVVDDLKKLTPGVKLIFQSAAAALIAFGRPWALFTTPLGRIDLGVFSVPLTFLWILGLTNAMNLLDGLDGLASGASFIASLSFFGIALLNGASDIALMTTVLCGCILGFLRYNFFPAKIFLGDSGSYFLGFTLAVLSLRGSMKGPAVLSILIPLLALGLPVMDTILAMLRRALKTLHIVGYDREKNQIKVLFGKGRAMFRADRDHIHHRLLKMGLTQKNAVILLYSVSLILGFVAFSITYFQNINQGAFFTLVVVAAIFAVQKLGYREIRIVGNGAFWHMLNAALNRSRFFLGYMDLATFALSYYFAFILRFGRNFWLSYNDYFLKTLPVLLAVKMLVFFVSGIYKRSWRYAFIGDLLKIMRTTLIGSVFSLLSVLALRGLPALSLSLWIIDFMVSSLFALGVRSSFRVAEHVQAARPEGRKRVLIYGLDWSSLILSEEMPHIRRDLIPVGFISDDLEKIGRSINGIPVLGTPASLREVLAKTEVDEVLIAKDRVETVEIEKIIDACRDRRTPVGRLRIRIEDCSNGPGAGSK